MLQYLGCRQMMAMELGDDLPIQGRREIVRASDGSLGAQAESGEQNLIVPIQDFEAAWPRSGGTPAFAPNRESVYFKPAKVGICSAASCRKSTIDRRT